MCDCTSGNDESGRVSAAAAADHGAHRIVGAEIFGAIDIEERAEFRPRPVDAAFDGADRAAADRFGVLIGEAGGADQNQSLALVLRNFVQPAPPSLYFALRALPPLRLQR